MMAGILTEIERLHKEKGQISVSLVGAGGQNQIMRCLAYYFAGTGHLHDFDEIIKRRSAFFKST
jgi:hypothetical protein